jgi:hypothetical protein
MSVCDDCYKKLVKAAIELKSPRQINDMSIEDYSKIFKQFILVYSSSKSTEILNNLFIMGLSENNKIEVRMFSFIPLIIGSDVFIDIMVHILSPMERIYKV